MFDKSLLDPSNPDLVAAESAAGDELSRGVASLPDRHAQADPRGAQLAAWSLVHGFSMLWLNDAVNTELKATDPMATVQRIAMMLFEE
jgi:Tetracyclin repressor-like, C-terminal domain